MTIYISQQHLWDLYYESEVQFRYYAILSDNYTKIKCTLNILIGALSLTELYFICKNLANPMDSNIIIFIIGFVGTLPGFLINLKTIDKSSASINASIVWNRARRKYENFYKRLLNNENIEIEKVNIIQSSLEYTEISTACIMQHDKALAQATKEAKSYLKPLHQGD